MNRARKAGWVGVDCDVYLLVGFHTSNQKGKVLKGNGIMEKLDLTDSSKSGLEQLRIFS